MVTVAQPARWRGSGSRPSPGGRHSPGGRRKPGEGPAEPQRAGRTRGTAGDIQSQGHRYDMLCACLAMKDCAQAAPRCFGELLWSSTCCSRHSLDGQTAKGARQCAHVRSNI